MLHIVTSNKTGILSILDYNQNFIICHLTERLLIPHAIPNTTKVFKIYHQDGMSLDDYTDYTNASGFQYNFIPVATVTEALDAIVDEIIADEDNLDAIARERDYTVDQIMLAIACEKSCNDQIIRYLNKEFADVQAETIATNLLTRYRATGLDQLAEMAKSYLNSEYIYPEDPVAFAYALLMMMGGRLQ